VPNVLKPVVKANKKTINLFTSTEVILETFLLNKRLKLLIFRASFQKLCPRKKINKRS